MVTHEDCNLTVIILFIVIVGTPDVGEEITEDIEADVDREEESSCTRLLAAAAERVWDIFLQNKREVGAIILFT